MNLNSTETAKYVLPYDSTCPVIYDNDETIDAYTDDVIMAYASTGEIKLVGMITSSSVQPFNKYVPSGSYLDMHKDRIKGVEFARKSGFKNIPNPVFGPNKHLEKPITGWIEDTIPQNTEGSRLIVETAKTVSVEKPLVIVMGGPLTVVADAYLLDQSIADKIVVAWLGDTSEGINSYNGWADPWSAFIVMQKLKMVVFPVFMHSPFVTKSKLHELPDTLFRQWMIDKYHITARIPDEHDEDAPPMISILRKDYVLDAKKVSFGYWKEYEGHSVPMFKDDPHGNTIVVLSTNREVATEEWWRTMKNPLAWGL